MPANFFTGMETAELTNLVLQKLLVLPAPII